MSQQLMQSQMAAERVLSTMGGTVNKKESALNSRMGDPNFGNSIPDLLSFNMEVAIWSASVGAMTNVMKDIGDAMKNVVQKG